ncbi:MAG: hypothetical protein R2688_03255 [Fimbriimonadaceae bacterium]
MQPEENKEFKLTWLVYSGVCIFNTIANIWLVFKSREIIRDPDGFAQRTLPQNIIDMLPPNYMLMVGWSFLFVGGLFAVLNFILPLMPKTHKWWLSHFVNICLGAGSCVMTLPCLWLLYRWLRPATRAVFGFPETPRR